MKKAFNFILSSAVAIVLIYLLFQFITGTINFYRGLDVSLQTALASAISLITVAGIGFFANKSVEQKKSIEASLRPRKLELYEEFVSFFLRVLENGKVNSKPTEKEIMKFFANSNPLIIAFASNKVIEKWGKLRLTMAEGDGLKIMLQLEDLLVEIRKDLGHSARGVHKGDVLRIVINDIDEHLKKSSK